MKTKQPKTKMNVRLLRRIERQIMGEPKQFNMGSWFWSNYDIPNCGTAACIAGWAATLSWKVKPCEARTIKNANNRAFINIASEMLGLRFQQATRLFFFDEWPMMFRRYPQNNPKQAVRRIEHFISTKGEE